MCKIHSPNCLTPTTDEKVARIVGDMRMGLPCLLRQGQSLAIMVAVEPLVEDRFAALSARFGTPELAITARRAWAVMTPAAGTSVVSSPVRIRPPENAGLDWFKRLADPGLEKTQPPSGPLHVLRSGDNALPNLAVELAKRAEILPAAVLYPVADAHSISDLSMEPLDADAALAVLSAKPVFAPVANATLPLEAHDVSQLHVFRDPNGRAEHYAIEIGTPDRSAPVLSRLHSACFTGDVLGSLKCDCGPQLRSALEMMGEEEAGVLLYLNQEGRGIGLANKMRVYDLQTQGFDTVEANHYLGFEDDERDFRVGATMLRTLGFDKVRLLTNNPAKVDTFKATGITITEQLPLRVGQNAFNHNYLAVKALKSGHML